jgi:hypothetical protein
MLQQVPEVLQVNPWSSDEDWAGHSRAVSAVCPLPSLGMCIESWSPGGDCCMGPGAICMVMVTDIADCA